MPKTNKEKEKVSNARLLASKLHSMVQLQHYEDQDRFIVVFDTGSRKLWVEWEKFNEIFCDFKAIVDVTKHK